MMTESVQGSIGAAAVTLESRDFQAPPYKAPPKGLPSATSSTQPPPLKSAPDQAPPTAQPPQVKRHFAKAPTVGVPHCPMPTRLPPGHPDALPPPPAHPANHRGEGSTGGKAPREAAASLSRKTASTCWAACTSTATIGRPSPLVTLLSFYLCCAP